MKVCSNEWRKLDRRARNEYFKIWRKKDRRERRAPFFVCLDCLTGFNAFQKCRIKECFCSKCGKKMYRGARLVRSALPPSPKLYSFDKGKRQMKYLAPIPKQFVDHSGVPLFNGTVHVYISGDTQYANVYQDADGEELMPNPARLDSNGAWAGFVTAGIPLDYVVKDKDGNVQFEYEKVVAGGGQGGGDGPVYVQESHTSSDSNVTVASQKTTCTFDSNLNDFTGELHVRFQNSGKAATVTFYVNNEYYDKAVSTLPVMTGVTHLMVPVSVKSGRLRAEVTFATVSTPSSVKFDLAGYNLGTGGGGSSGGGGQTLTFVAGGSSGGVLGTSKNRR